MSTVNIDVHASAFIKDLTKHGKSVESGVEEFSENFVEAIMEESSSQVPRQTGSLANSTYVNNESDSKTVKFEFGYGGGNEQINPISGQSTDEYAVEVHENLAAIHPNGKAKFLEDPCREAEGKFASELAKALR